MQSVKIVVAEFAIFGLIAKNAEGDQEQAVSGGDNGLANAVLSRLAVEERTQIAVLLTCGRPGRLTKSPPQPAIAFARAVAEPLAAALVIARTESGPGSRVARAGEDLHVGTELGPQ